MFKKMIDIDLNVDVRNIQEEEDTGQINCSRGFRIDLNCLPQEEEDFIEENIEIDLTTLQRDEEYEPEVEVDDHVTGNIISENEKVGHQINTKRKRYLSNNHRQLVLNMLLAESNKGKLKRTTTKRVASVLSVNLRTVQRIWRRYKRNESPTVSRKVGNCGRKKISFNPEEIRQIPLHQRTTIRRLACALNVGSSTVYRHKKRGGLRRHSSSLKPLLTEENKVSRLKFCISMLEEDSIPNDPTFKRMYNVIQIDEKWFYIKPNELNYYLLPVEEDPLRTCKNKNYIQRVMFLVALARPRFDDNGLETFSGKIGVFPFVVQEPARRNSVNKHAGTLETKAITSRSKEVIRSIFIEKLLPAIKEKWPIEDQGSPIIIQQDNAKPHLDGTDELFRQEARSLGLDIHVLRQPPCSPDLNVLDLGLFSSIQSLEYKETPRNVDQLVNAVERAYADYSSKMCNRIFLSLQSGMIEIMKAKGCNKFKTPHINKERLEREGNLPTQLKCVPTLVQEMLHYLS